MIYLASPYTHKNPIIMEDRYNQNVSVYARLLQKGVHVISPIILGHVAQGLMMKAAQYYHPTQEYTPMPRYDFWLQWSSELLGLCHTMYIIQIPGWAESRGVASEIDDARRQNIIIQWLCPYTLETTDEPK